MLCITYYKTNLVEFLEKMKHKYGVNFKKELSNNESTR